MSAPLWRWDRAADTLATLDDRVERALGEVDAEPEHAQAAAARLVGALRERAALRAQCEEDADALRAGLVGLTRALNSTVGRPGPVAAVQAVLDEVAGPGVRVDPVLEVPGDRTPGPRARAYLDAVAGLVTVAAGARADQEELEARVRRVEEGWADLLDELRPSRPPLTPREEEVLALVRQGLTNAAIAERLYVSLDTVKTHVRSLLAKHGVRGRAALAGGPSKE